MFCVPNHWWNPEVERPRLLFILSSIVFIGFSKLFFLIGDGLIVRIMSSLLYALGIFLLYFVWSKEFEKKFIGLIKTKLMGSQIKSIYSKGYDLEKVLQDFNFLNCDLETFKDLLNGNKIADEKRIVCELDKRKLIRFVFIIFRFKEDVSHDKIKKIISHYFLYEKMGIKPYSIQEKASEISDVISEMLQEDRKFSSLNEEIYSVFQSHKITEP
jgi:hypothetical protein